MNHRKFTRYGWMISLSIMISGPCLAQTDATPPDAPSLPKGDYVTKLKIIPQPMTALLDQGYKIVNLAVGLGGVGYLLHRDNQWVACSVIQSSQAGQNRAVSHCAALN